MPCDSSNDRSISNYLIVAVTEGGAASDESASHLTMNKPNASSPLSKLPTYSNKIMAPYLPENRPYCQSPLILS
jgi:hypothetical protein